MYNSITFVCIACFHTIFLKIFIAVFRDGKWKDEKDTEKNQEMMKINDELTKVCVIKIALDVLVTQWTIQLFMAVGYFIN